MQRIGILVLLFLISVLTKGVNSAHIYDCTYGLATSNANTVGNIYTVRYVEDLDDPGYYFLCDGSEISIQDYSELYLKLGDGYITSNGNFRIPELCEPSENLTVGDFRYYIKVK